MAHEFWFLVGPTRVPKRSIMLYVKWNPPVHSHVVLNTDAFFDATTGICRTGGVFRDYYGNWILGFASSSYSANTLEAEAKAAFQELSIGQEHAISSIQINIDSKELVAQFSCSPTNNCPLLCDCRCLLQRMGCPDICHIYREQNRLADALVSTITTTISFMHNSPATVMLFWESPPSLMDILRANQHGDLTARRVKYSSIDQDVHNISVVDVVHIPTSLARATSANSSVMAMPQLMSL
ncbi:hypothetical protein P3S68_011897 [Capsicum galapagoense]